MKNLNNFAEHSQQDASIQKISDSPRNNPIRQ